MNLVLDASAAVDWLLGKPEAETFGKAIEEADRILAPDLYASEIGNAFWKLERGGRIPAGRGRELLLDGLELVQGFVPATELLAEAFEEAARRGHPVYDLLYLVTARRNAAPLATSDAGLRELAKSLGVSVVE